MEEVEVVEEPRRRLISRLASKSVGRACGGTVGAATSRTLAFTTLRVPCATAGQLLLCSPACTINPSSACCAGSLSQEPSSCPPPTPLAAAAAAGLAPPPAAPLTAAAAAATGPLPPVLEAAAPVLAVAADATFTPMLLPGLDANVLPGRDSWLLLAPADRLAAAAAATSSRTVAEGICLKPVPPLLTPFRPELPSRLAAPLPAVPPASELPVAGVFARGVALGVPGCEPYCPAAALVLPLLCCMSDSSTTRSSWEWGSA